MMSNICVIFIAFILKFMGFFLEVTETLTFGPPKMNQFILSVIEEEIQAEPTTFRSGKRVEPT